MHFRGAFWGWMLLVCFQSRIRGRVIYGEFEGKGIPTHEKAVRSENI